MRIARLHALVRLPQAETQCRGAGQGIIPTWNEIRSGRDPVLEWVLSQPTG
jgi:hypothetical protein